MMGCIGGVTLLDSLDRYYKYVSGTVLGPGTQLYSPEYLPIFKKELR